MEEHEEEDPDEDPEEPIEQLVPEPNNIDGFALHPLPLNEGNMNGWLIKDDDDELEEDGTGDDDKEEMEMDENNEENGRNYNEAEVINPYEEADPLNRLPLTSDEESEFAPHVVLIIDANNELMFDRYKTEIRMAKKFKEGDLRMNLYEYDITSLDAVVRERISKGLLFQEEPYEPSIHHAFAPRLDDPYVMVKEAVIGARDDDGDGTTTPTNSQPSEPRGSPHDP
nr:hypothetical protein [Tanacetum cinerariifolium]